jgi:hypothetical protein
MRMKLIFLFEFLWIAILNWNRRKQQNIPSKVPKSNCPKKISIFQFSTCLDHFVTRIFNFLAFSLKILWCHFSSDFYGRYWFDSASIFFSILLHRFFIFMITVQNCNKCKSMIIKKNSWKNNFLFSYGI